MSKYVKYSYLQLIDAFKSKKLYIEALCFNRILEKDLTDTFIHGNLSMLFLYRAYLRYEYRISQKAKEYLLKCLNDTVPSRHKHLNSLCSFLKPKVIGSNIKVHLQKLESLPLNIIPEPVY